MEKFKLWAAVDENGDVYVYVGDKPKYSEEYEEWLNNQNLPGADCIFVCSDSELKAGAEAIKEIEFELPTEGEEEEASKGVDLYFAVDSNREVWLYPDEPKNNGSFWYSTEGAIVLGETKDPVSFEKSLCKIHLNIPYEITSENEKDN